MDAHSKAIPSSLRRANERILIGLLARKGPASRADLAKAAGMSQPTAGKIIREWLELGAVEELSGAAAQGEGAGESTARVGRPGRMVRLDPNRPRFLAIQLGVAETRLAALPVAVRGEDCWTHLFPTPNSPQRWREALQQTAGQIRTRHLWGTLISVPGIVNEPDGKVLFSPNLHWTEQVSLPELVGAIWPMPVLLVQEIRALALGHLAAEPQSEDFLLVDFGQGVGGAIIESGRLFSSPLPLNGEFGHTPVPGNSRPCGCGAIGCVETLVSRRGLLQSYAESGVSDTSTWPALVQYLSTEGVPDWLQAALNAAAATIAGALNVLGLRHVVVTGSLTELPPVVMECLAAGIRKGSVWARFGDVFCQAAPRRRGAGLVGVGIDRLLVPSAGRGRKLPHRTRRSAGDDARSF